MHFCSASIIALFVTSLSVKCDNENDYDSYLKRDPSSEVRKSTNGINTRNSGYKSIAKAMLDLKYKYRNASLGSLYLGYNDLIEKSARRMPMLSKLQHRERSHKVTHQEASSDFDAEFSPYSIARHLQSLIPHFPQANITLEVIGKTLSYNDIVMLKITEQKDLAYFRADDSKYIDETPEKKILFIVHGLSVMGFRQLPCLIEEKKFVLLMRMYLSHLNQFDIFLIPMANPDGVAMPQSLWNKNASPQSACSGVAVDRNFDVAWNVSKSITSCSQQYPGPKPFSEIESRVIRETLHKYSQKIIAYIHVHAGTYSADIFKGDAVLHPKGYTDVVSEEDKYVDLKGEIDEAMKNASFEVVSVAVDTLHNWYDIVHGTSVDYATTAYGIPYAMEFVMQIYANDMFTINSEEKETNVVLEEVWGRVINVTFDNIYKSLHVNEVRK